jgi:uncharacterized SAM-dependent methyltransferase
MLDIGPTSQRSTLIAAELRDALGRRQKELPSRWLVSPVDASYVGAGASGPTESAEVDLCRTLLESDLADVPPRGVVCVRASAAPATALVVNAARARGGLAAVALVESDVTTARTVGRHFGERVSANGVAVGAFAADCTLALPPLDAFPRPRLYLCLGNALGAVTAVGAVRMLRVFRSTMNPGDTLLLGLATAAAPAGVDPTSHLDALERINDTFGASLMGGRFDCESRYDAEQRRSETHLVARRAFEAQIPGVCDVRFRKGESIRTSVSCTFDRARTSAMLAGVGFTLQAWEADPTGTVAVALAVPAT